MSSIPGNQDPDPIGPEDYVEHALVVAKETKSAWRTTEFWLTVVSILAVQFNGIPLPESKEGYVAAALAGLYALSRGLAKKGVPHYAEVGR